MDWYSLVRRDDNGKLVQIPYHVAYSEEITKAASLLREAAELSEDEDLKIFFSYEPRLSKPMTI